MNKKVVGIDIGNVIIDHRLVDSNDTTLYEERYSTVPSTDGVFDAVKKFVVYCNGEVYLISKCSEWAQEKIKDWLIDNSFYEKTGVHPEHVHFVRNRDEKDGVCNMLAITHFIDDRLEVLSYMIDSGRTLILFQPNQEEIEQFRQYLPNVTVVQTWNEAVEVVER